LVPEFILSILAVICVFFRSRSDTAIEDLALLGGSTAPKLGQNTLFR
jgi:hypothetical protein